MYPLRAIGGLGLGAAACWLAACGVSAAGFDSRAENTCGIFACAIACPDGYQTNTHGCPKCACLESGAGSGDGGGPAGPPVEGEPAEGEGSGLESSCAANADCQKIPGGCCDCSAGGEMIAANNAGAERYLQTLLAQCGESDCLGENTCASYGPAACLEGACALVAPQCPLPADPPECQAGEEARCTEKTEGGCLTRSCQCVPVGPEEVCPPSEPPPTCAAGENLTCIEEHDDGGCLVYRCWCGPEAQNCRPTEFRQLAWMPCNGLPDSTQLFQKWREMRDWLYANCTGLTDPGALPKPEVDWENEMVVLDVQSRNGCSAKSQATIVELCENTVYCTIEAYFDGDCAALVWAVTALAMPKAGVTAAKRR